MNTIKTSQQITAAAHSAVLAHNGYLGIDTLETSTEDQIKQLLLGVLELSKEYCIDTAEILAEHKKQESSLRRRLELNDIESSDLDELVDEAATRLASRINNEGQSEQLEYLNRWGFNLDTSHNYEPEELDEMVDEATARNASQVNNEGMKDQLEFLESVGYSDDEIFQHVL
ncbi:TPA: hypothetical protein I7730_00185 [Vibrio vulnificus]|uniref:Uncharacterized protein n=1 Tax=Vibrio vulnificus TaxID=672 RepID=A0A8H9MY26_VIBVL|nr:hypothetical protein [Vibrio vulnificus]HAS8538216.1 hypothetical protein [Vibrio vulnificus]